MEQCYFEGFFGRLNRKYNCLKTISGKIKLELR